MADDPMLNGLDDEIDINLRAPADAAARLIVLGAVSRRAFLEQRQDAIADDDSEAERFDLHSWLREERLDEFVSESEAAALATPVTQLSTEETTAAIWSIEGAVAVAWVIGLVAQIPDYDQPADIAPLLALIPTPWDSTAEFRSAARMRTESEIVRERERAEVWNERADHYFYQLAASGSDRRESEAIVAEMAAESRAAGYTPSLILGDFPVHGGPYRDLDPELAADLQSVAFNRLSALNWVSGVTDE